MAYLMNKNDKIASLFQSYHYQTVIESLAMINKCNTSATCNEFKWAKGEYTVCLTTPLRQPTTPFTVVLTAIIM